MAPHSISPFPEREYQPGYDSPGFSAPVVNSCSTQSKSEPIAIVGLACRLPGESSSASKFWDLLRNGRSGQSDIPSSRFNVDGFYHPKGSDRPGSINMRGGYFIQEDIRAFENSFFGINNVEATHMDPQQRKLLEVVFECFESAGIPLEKLSGSNTGCYVGNFTIDFPVMQGRDIDEIHRYTAIGGGSTILSNRISHAFNLTGPSFVLDTACSSSLYCLHAACAALEAGECDGAIVAAANLIQSIEQHASITKVGVLSKTSTCHTFDASADGYGRADGVGALFLKKLSDAIRDGDPIRSVIRGTAVNSNGKTQGITLPSANGQEAVIRKAYRKAGLDFNDTTYVECHGTGTPVGDPIEVEAVSRVFKKSHDNKLLVGSVKTNVGHSEAASGISSVIKVALALENGFIPASIGVTQINPKIKTAEWGIKIVTDGQNWPDSPSQQPGRIFRRAGINSFGYGGANAHAILESASSHIPSSYGNASNAMNLLAARRLFLLPFSASTKEALESRVIDLSEYNLNTTSVHDLAYTLGTRRSHLGKRGYIVASKASLSQDIRIENLRALLKEPGASPSRYAFIFTGQGAQWPEMCKELLEEAPIFRNAVAEMDSVLQSLPHAPQWTLHKAILEPKATSMIMDPTRSQPTCTAIQVALIILLESWGITPSAVLGHSSGEIAAAFAAGYISSSQAIIIAYYRGYVVGKNALDGAMIAAGLSREDADTRIASLQYTGRIRVACINSPESVTISGDASAIEGMLSDLQSKGQFARKLQTGGRAYHSHHMLALGDEYQRLLAGHQNRGTFKMPIGATWISSVTGEIMDETSTSPSYWRKNLENPVEFAQAVARLSQEGMHHIIELGPHSALELPIKQTLSKLNISSDDMPYSSAIIRNKDAVECALNMVGRIYLYGNPISFEKVNESIHISNGGSKLKYRVLHDLPKYRWTYAESPLWHESRASSELRNRKHRRHELLGARVPAGNGLEISWKNFLRVEDVPWLKDHKLEETIVFPGAGYLAMAIEAISQASDFTKDVKRIIYMRNFNILSALALSSELNTSIELFTTLRPTPITYASTSADWWEFTVVSFVDGVSTTHATGTLRIAVESSPIQSKLEVPKDSLEPSASRIWYEKLAKKGLNFGPNFRTITDFSICRLRTLKNCRTTVPLLQEIDNEAYPIHPVTIDALLQTSIVACTAGNTRDLRAKVPTKVGSAAFTIDGLKPAHAWSISSNAKATGFGSVVINAELVNADGEAKVQLDNVRLAPFEAAGNLEIDDNQRHPMLRVLWKPDVSPGLMTAEDFTKYLDSTATESQANRHGGGSLELSACLSLISHKNPYLRILELGNGARETTKDTLDSLLADTPFVRLLSYTTARIDENGQLFGSKIDVKTREVKKAEALPLSPEFDLVILSDFGTSQVYLERCLEELKSLLSSRGIILGFSKSTKTVSFQGAGLSTIETQMKNVEGNVFLSHRLEDDGVDVAISDGSIIIVEQVASALGDVIINEIKAITGQEAKRVLFENISTETVPPGKIVFSLLESESSILATLSDVDMSRIKTMTHNASSLVWITAGNLLNGGKPNHSLAFGLSRAVMMEQPSLRFFVYDVDDITRDMNRTARNVVSVFKRSSENLCDFEYIERDGVVHISRFVPDDHLNEAFRQNQGAETMELPLVKAQPAQLSIKSPGQFDTVFFKQINMPEIEADQVQIAVKAVGLNAKDFYALGGKTDTRNACCTLEYCGIVEKLGSEVTDLAIGDRVVVMAPGFFKTSEIVPSWACQKLQQDENFNTMCTLPLVYSTAIYALYTKANIQPGESVLIHSGAGGVGIAAIQLAQLAGAEVFTTVSTDAKRQFLVKELGVKPENIFTSRDTSFEASVMEATNGRGVDVVLNSLTGDLLHASWRCCGSFGRFIEIGKRDATDAGRLAMDQFLKNASFIAFDLSELYFSSNPAHNRAWASLRSQVLSLYRQKKITEFPLEVFDIQDLSNALRRFGSRNRTGKITINMEQPNSLIKVEPFRYSMEFYSNKSYLMIGCLGGLGRSLAKWMLERGARKFVFLGRSALDKAPARRLVEDLTKLGAKCKVVRGGVCTLGDVQEMVKQADGPIGGVVQAAMGLNHALFSVMPNKYWHTGIDPKVQGTWNIHHSLKDNEKELDFFLLTSSISGSVGTATESNYCAANYFLDNFARYRRSLGLPATSVGLGMISEVGYLHDNPEIESLLLRKGITQINESEMLAMIDISLSKSLKISQCYDIGAEAHVLTGLEPFGMLELRKKGYTGSAPLFKGARPSILARALHNQDDNQVARDGDLPAEITKARESGTSLSDAITAHVAKRFGDLVLIPANQVNISKSLDSYGMDSMIAAEFRAWFYQTFKVDIPFLQLLSKTVTVSSLSKIVTKEVEARP